ncbi:MULTISPECIES: pyruvate kinase [unclassified Thioalkalivibrio]|uniref:pyruvate kinase n=1 Tax=unclassified Thioalkalivibrio TaxID=2621013 RepID=UPI000365237C|nr:MULTISPECIES: pyruvate kinase [unclassified Thioalkalivibrio]
MPFPAQKTKIVATIGPASDSPDTLRRMMQAGLNVTRLNFSHGDAAYHTELISRIREAAQETGARVAILGDLPGPKMRIGELAEEPIELEPGATITLTTEDCVGDASRVNVSFSELPEAVQPGDALFLNDGYIELEVVSVEGREVACRVLTGGELRSRKGLNLPGIDLGIRAFTLDDHDWLRFAAEHGVDAVSQSFVVDGDDILAVRKAAEALGYNPFIIAKIERAAALEQLDGILEAADGIMVARGDLGVEIPIASIARAQRRITRRANQHNRPVITATQMLESMVTSRRPTRAEATDVANAILGGTDCVMLSGESAMGRYPVESVAMLAAIARSIEPERDSGMAPDSPDEPEEAGHDRAVDLIARSVFHTAQRRLPRVTLAPTLSGATARRIARLRLPCWVAAFTPDPETAQNLQFSYGVQPVAVAEDRSDWNDFARQWLAENAIHDGLALLVQGPSGPNPTGNHRLELLELDSPRQGHAPGHT